MRARRSNTVRNRRVPRQAGFSLLEVLVGFFILLLVVMGLLPLFTRAVVANISGKEATVVTNIGTTQLENLVQLSFNNFGTSIPIGNNVNQTIDYWGRDDDADPGTEDWAPSQEFATWRRTTEVRQFGVGSGVDTNLDGVPDALPGLEDDNYDGYFDSELAGGTTPNAIHLKEVRVLIESQRTPFGAGEPTELTLRTLKAF